MRRVNILSPLLLSVLACGDSPRPNVPVTDPGTPTVPVIDEPIPPVAASSFPVDGFGERAVLSYVNASLDAKVYEADGQLASSAAAMLVSQRNGADGVGGTLDDRPYGSVAELLTLPDVFESNLDALYWAALRAGFIPRDSNVIFSPQPDALSHTAALVKRIDEARRSIDIAMFSHTEVATARALVRAAQRGVQIRYLLDDVRRVPGQELEGSFLSTIEGKADAPTGSDIRYTDPGLHHKFVIIDGAVDSPEAARWARVSIGSGNLSFAAAAHANEATLFFTDEPELALRLQREFETLWRTSKDFQPTPSNPARPVAVAHYLPEEQDIPDSPDLELLLTSQNWEAQTDGTWQLVRHHTVGQQLADLISSAHVSVRIASRYLRSRPVADALLAAVRAHPGLEVQLLVDQRDTVSRRVQRDQSERRDACLLTAGADIEQQRVCSDAGYGFSFDLERAGAQVRFKTYASDYEPLLGQPLHHKYIVIDGSTLVVGSYNLTYTSEHKSFESVVVLRGERYAALVRSFEDNFSGLWNLGRNDALPKLEQMLKTAAVIPLIFDDKVGLSAMSLTRSEAGKLRNSIWSVCGLRDLDHADFSIEADEEGLVGRGGPRSCPRVKPVVAERSP